MPYIDYPGLKNKKSILKKYVQHIVTIQEKLKLKNVFSLILIEKT